MSHNKASDVNIGIIAILVLFEKTLLLILSIMLQHSTSS